MTMAYDVEAVMRCDFQHLLVVEILYWITMCSQCFLMEHWAGSAVDHGGRVTS